ncbi:MAG: glycosyltransferase family 2 protein [Cyanobacteriota bacterium]|nr:glycosyltransferase family 2 protein [Cyanobacteriota bacterium]
MRLVLTLLCRDEADVVEEMLAFHLSHGVDMIVATDNRSTDATRSLLERHQRAGRLFLLDEPSLTHDQAPWVTRMARIAVDRFEADWVINADADEFWWPLRGNLKEALAGVCPADQVLRIQRTNFLPPDPAAEVTLPFYESMTLRERQSLNSLGHPLPAKVCHRGLPLVSVDDGNHGVRLEGQPLPAIPFSEIEILHFPVRSPSQFERKIRQGAEALERNPRTAGTGIGATWRQIYQQYWLQDRLGDYYHTLRPSAEGIRLALETGALIEDRRLRDSLRAVLASPPPDPA